jgi:hypothetical protein
VKLIFTGLSQSKTDLEATLDDLRAMVEGSGSESWWRRLLSYL